jgi:protein-arginine kinase
MEIHLISYYIGIFIIFGCNAYIIFKSKDKDMINYSWLNILGAFLIAYYFMDKENMWDVIMNKKEKVLKAIKEDEEDYNC